MKNIAFEATEKEVRQLFSPLGQVIYSAIAEVLFGLIARFSLRRLFSLLTNKQTNHTQFMFLLLMQIKGFRLLPKRHCCSNALVEFMTKQEASNAKMALSNTHLYGRHLVSPFVAFLSLSLSLRPPLHVDAFSTTLNLPVIAGD